MYSKFPKAIVSIQQQRGTEPIKALPEKSLRKKEKIQSVPGWIRYTDRYADVYKMIAYMRVIL